MEDYIRSIIKEYNSSGDTKKKIFITTRDLKSKNKIRHNQDSILILNGVKK